MTLDRRLKTATIVVSFIGLVDSLYLTWVKLSNNTAACLPGIGNCEAVNTSRYSEVFGIPVALLGAIAYLILLGIVLLEDKIDWVNLYSRMGVFGLTFAGLLYSAYLTYLEIAVIRAVCPFCVISAVCILILFVLSIARLRISNSE